MPEIDVESCLSFVLANRLIADRFRDRSDEARKLAQAGPESQRARLTALSEEADLRAALHDKIASNQEEDLGRVCHCPIRRHC